MCSKKKGMRLRKEEKERVLHPTDTNFVKMLEDRVDQVVLGTSINQVLWNEDPPDTPRTFAGFVRIFSENTATSLKGSALVSYQEHLVLFNIRKECSKRLLQRGYGLVSFLRVESEKIEGTRGAGIRGHENQNMVIPHRR